MYKNKIKYNKKAVTVKWKIKGQKKKGRGVNREVNRTENMLYPEHILVC